MSNQPISRTLALYVGAYVVFLYLPMTLHSNFLFQRQRPGRVSTQRFHVSLV